MSNLSLPSDVVAMSKESPFAGVVPKHVMDSIYRLTAAERNAPIDTGLSSPATGTTTTMVSGGTVQQGAALVMMDNEGAHIVDDTVADKFRKKQISASLITDLREGCPAAWLMKTYVVPEVIEEPDDTPMARGSLFHRVMEHFFTLPPAERTKEKMLECVRTTIFEDDFKVFADNRDVAAWLQVALRGYYQMGFEDPQDVRVASMVKHGEETPALEAFVKGRVDGVKRNLIGFIDRVSETDSGVLVEDWKTGGKAKEWSGSYPVLTKGKDGVPYYDTRHALGYVEARQQGMYTMLLEQQGYEVEGARLIFPVAQSVVDVPVHDPEFRGEIEDNIRETDKILDDLECTNEFTYRPSVLCSWCPLAKICPAAQEPFRNSEKQVLARESQPEPEVFQDAVMMRM